MRPGDHYWLLRGIEMGKREAEHLQIATLRKVEKAKLAAKVKEFEEEKKKQKARMEKEWRDHENRMGADLRKLNQSRRRLDDDRENLDRHREQVNETLAEMRAINRVQEETEEASCACKRRKRGSFPYSSR
jgi:uncharacterized protein YlxW (UPF0749 family)